MYNNYPIEYLMIRWIDLLMISLVPRGHDARGHGEVSQGQLEEGQQGPGEGAKIFEDLRAAEKTWNQVHHLGKNLGTFTDLP
jgi:hypothetical protein